jgi:signal transduction histidine kinase
MTHHEQNQRKNRAAQRADSFSIITEFSRDMGTLSDFNALSIRIVNGLSHCADLPEASLFLLDHEKEVFRRIVCQGPLAQDHSTQKLSANHPLLQRLIADREILIRSSITGQTDTDEGTEAILSTFETLHASLCIPLISKGRMIGLCTLGPSDGLPPDAEHTIPLLTALAQNAANAMDNAVLYEDLRRSQTLMRRTDRLRSLEIIAGGFAHEIRNPLTSIKTFIQLAPERKDDTEFIRDFSKVVLDDVYRIERLIQEILDYARYMEPRLTDEDLNDIVVSCLYFIDVRAESRGIKVEKELANDLPRVMLDRQQLKQVLLNLLLNAMDSMGDKGGALKVRTHRLAKPGGKVWAQIEVEDTGQGISPENLEHIFDPFFTTKHESGEHEGTGLGLTIAHQIVQEHHGDIYVESTLGVGTTFYIGLPTEPIGQVPLVTQEIHEETHSVD